MKMYSFVPLVLAASCSLSLVSGCSSSDNESEISIGGSIVAAPVNGAAVTIIDTSGNTVAGPVNTNAAGQYSLKLTDDILNQDLVIKSSGGSFTDEATGNQGITAGNLLAYVPANTLNDGSRISATPASTIIADLVMHQNKTMSQAQTAFANAFGFTPDISVDPVDVTSPPADASAEEKLAGFRAAAFSELTLELGLTSAQQFDLLSALTEDLSDDVLDGVNASGLVNIGTGNQSLEADIQNRFSMALVNFHGSAYNQTGLTNDQIGNVPFSKVAFTDSYRIEYIETSMMTVDGKSVFQIHVTDRSTGADVTGLSPMLMPMMHMSTMTHSSPVAMPAVTEDGNGLYTVTVYYLMASQMMDGTSMGYWDLKLTLAGEEAHFYPVVKMAMGDTVRTRLKGQNDFIKDMMGNDVSRDYFIFRDSLTGTGPYTLTLYIVAKENMMSFPPFVVGSTLDSGMGGTPLTIDTMSVNVSVDGSSPIAATSNDDGTWSVSVDLTNGVANQLEVELLVNGERKTSDGTAAGLNAFFTITPDSM